MGGHSRIEDGMRLMSCRTGPTGYVCWSVGAFSTGEWHELYIMSSSAERVVSGRVVYVGCRGLVDIVGVSLSLSCRMS